MTGIQIQLRSFGKGGIHVDSGKERTAHKPIEPLVPSPREVWLPLVESFGAVATEIVKKGELVARGQKIAEAGPGGVPVHASLSGRVKPTVKRAHPTLVTAPMMVLEAATGAPPPLEFPEDPSWRDCPRDEMLARIREAGIVGLGGAAFPTFRKLALPAGTTIDTVVINGSECEPFLTADFRTMLAYPQEVVEGARLMARLTGGERVLIGIEADKLEARAPLERAAAEFPGGVPVEVVPCEVRYPQGAERQLVTSLTGRVVPARALPLAVGVLVQNVATAQAVCEAVRYRRPLLDRVITVTGPGVRDPKNILAPLGTPLSQLVSFCGGMAEATTRLVAGGPMMGRALPRLDLPLLKGMNGLSLLTGPGPLAEGYNPCIQCGRCVEACPLGLEPDQVSVRVEAGRTLDTDPFGATDCYECGCCTYVCPAERPLLQFMQIAKSALRRARQVKAG